MLSNAPCRNAASALNSTRRMSSGIDSPPQGTSPKFDTSARRDGSNHVEEQELAVGSRIELAALEALTDAE